MEMNKFTIKHQNEQKLFSSTMPTNLKKIQLALCQSTLCKVSHMKTLIGATGLLSHTPIGRDSHAGWQHNAEQR